MSLQPGDRFDGRESPNHSIAVAFGLVTAALVGVSLLPVLLLAALVVLSGVVAVQSIAGGLFALTHLAVLGLAAATYERIGSLAVPPWRTRACR